MLRHRSKAKGTPGPVAARKVVVDQITLRPVAKATYGAKVQAHQPWALWIAPGSHIFSSW